MQHPRKMLFTDPGRHPSITSLLLIVTAYAIAGFLLGVITTSFANLVPYLHRPWRVVWIGGSAFFICGLVSGVHFIYPYLDYRIRNKQETPNKTNGE